MGYYTKFTLEILEGNDYKTDYEKGIAEVADYGYCFDSEIKWYNHEADMLTYSELHPNVVFALNGEGEESEDMWVKYFKNGKMAVSKAIITFEPYKEENLK